MVITVPNMGITKPAIAINPIADPVRSALYTLIRLFFLSSSIVSALKMLPVKHAGINAKNNIRSIEVFEFSVWKNL